MFNYTPIYFRDERGAYDKAVKVLKEYVEDKGMYQVILDLNESLSGNYKLKPFYYMFTILFAFVGLVLMWFKL